MTSSPIPDPPQEFHDALKSAGIALDPGDLERIASFLQLLYAANERMNLTGVRDPSAAWMRHIFDSLTLLSVLTGTQAVRAADIGSGGGIPGLILALVLPEVEFTLIESVGKKARFLEETATALGLKKVVVRQERAEVLGVKEIRESMDVVVSRAVGKLPSLLEYALPMVRPGGLFVAIKGEQGAAEVVASIHALGELRGVVIEQRRTLTGTLVIVEKTGRTPRRYPREKGEPERNPL
ncbi:MAG: 16S rRNA (guanine(527)-N(7))-methyltransferase RsmG [Phycisphaerales bacterium]|nr:16S rRNA (guanine(527)-N(7))-methyltransferase RsmG [Phycisphaerales bacterium]